MPGSDIAGLLGKAGQNASTLEHANQQLGDEASAFDVWTHTYEGMSERLRDFAEDPVGTLQQYDRDLDAAVEAGVTGDWHSSSMSAVGDSFMAQLDGLGDAVDAIGEAEGALATVGATFALLTGVEQMLSTLVSVIPFPSLPAIRVMDMDVGLPHAHSHPPNLVPPAPPVPLPSTGPIIPIPILSGATRTLINGMPAARCGDMGLGIWCGGYFPMYEVFLGSSSVWIEGARAGRLAVDITKHCIFTSPKPSDPPLGPMVGVTISASANVLIGGVPMPSLLSLAMGAAMKGLMGGLGRAIRRLQATRLGTRFAGRVQNLADDVMDALGIRLGSRLRNRISRTLCTITGHPVDVATGKVFTEHVDFELPGPLPFRFERCWYSCSSYEGPLGHGWHHTLDLGLVDDPESGCVVVRLADGRHVGLPRPDPGEAVFHRAERLTLRRGPHYELTTSEGLRYVFSLSDASPARISSNRTEWVLSTVKDPNDNRVQLLRKEGRLTAIVDSARRALAVKTDAEGRIMEIRAPHPDHDDADFGVVRYSYDADGNLVSVADCRGAPLSYRYSDHLLVQETDRAGVSFFFEYDDDPISPRCIHTWGDGGIFERRLSYDDVAGVTRVEDSYGAVTRYYWNELGLVHQTTDTHGNTTRTEWSEQGQRLSDTDALGASTTFRYDGDGRLVGTTNALGDSRTIEHDREGNVVRIETEAGAVWEWVYDDRGNITAVVDPAGRRTRFERDARGLTTRILDVEGYATRLVYDAAGNLVRAVDRAGLDMRMTYDRLGRIREQWDNGGTITRYEWDLLGNLVGIVDSTGNRDEFAYDASGNLIREVDGSGNAIHRGYGAAGPGGKLAHVREPTGSEWWYRYDREGHLTEVRDVLGRRWRFERDILGRLVRETDFEGREHEYEHDALGRVVKWTKLEGGATEIEWNPVGRVVAQTYADGRKEEYSYDRAGRLERAVNEDAEVLYEFDKAGRVLRETINDRAVVHRYDEMGNRVARISPHGREVLFRYDPEGRMTEVADDVGTLLRRSHDYLGREVARYFASGHVSRREYGERALLCRHGLRGRGRRVFDRRYGYDASGRLNRVTDRRGSTHFAHDALGRLTRATSGRDAVRFEHDAAGNSTGMVREGPSDHEPTGGWSVVRDRDGNIVEKSRGSDRYRYRYDSAGRMCEAETPNGSKVSFSYDALGRRLSKTVEGRRVTYLWDRNQILSETVEEEGRAVESREYVFDGLRPLCILGRARKALLLETDHIERPTVAISRTGRGVWSSEYDLTGHPRNDGPEAPPLRFPGQIYDPETRLSYNRLRYFDPDLGSFTQPDPVGLRGGLRAYNYVPDPNTWADPFGLMPHEMEAWIERGGQEVPGTREAVESGGLTQEEAGRWGLNSHTERKYLNQVGDEIRPGDVVRMQGELDPCQPGCRPALRDVVDETGASVVYESSSTGRTWTFRPAADGEFPRARADVVLEVSENGKVVSRHRYYRSASGRWVRRPC